jgi:hypothetical protein
MSWKETERKLREAAQLWALGQKLPHLPTEHERKLLAEFDAFVAGREVICGQDAAEAGLRALWSRQEFAQIGRVAARLPPELQRDREVCTYAANALLRLQRAPG